MSELSWIDEARRVAAGIRRRVLAHVLAHNGGYLTQACSSAEMLAALYVRLLQLGEREGPALPEPFAGVPRAGLALAGIGARFHGKRAPELDRFIFSPVHYALSLYCALIETGRLAPEALEVFNRDGSTMEMIGAEHSPGIEVTAGSLAQALSQAAGMALGRKLKGEAGRVWAFLSDGELQEGQTWEAFAAARFHRLHNLRVLIDLNGQQCDGEMARVMCVEPAADRLRAFGARVFEVDGHDLSAIVAAGEQPAGEGPTVLLCRTDAFRGVELLRERGDKLHHLRFRDEAERARYAAHYQQMVREQEERQP